MHDSRVDSVVILFSVFLALALFSTNNSGLLVTDEAAYTLTLHSLYTNGRLNIWNGNDEVSSMEMVLPQMVYYFTYSGAVNMYGGAAPLYAFFALPFYHVFGIDGLIFMNIFFYALTIIIVYYLALLFLGSRKQALIAFLAYSLTSYSIQYTRLSIPHMLSVFLVVFSVYLFLHQHVRKRDMRVIFYSGFLLGLSFGIRYSNIVFIAVAVFFIYRFYGLMNSITFLTGSGLGALPTLAINQIYYESFLKSGYGSIFRFFQNSLVMEVIILLPLAIIALSYFGSKKDRRRVLVFLAVILLLLILFKPGFADSIGYRIGNVYTKIFDMTKLDPTMYDRESTLKKALLQSTPYLILGFFAFLNVRNIQEKNIISFMSGMIFSIIIFYTFVWISVGGIDETYGVRYFLEAIPFLTILSVFSVRRWIDRVEISNVGLFVFALIGFTFFFYIKQDLLYPDNLGLRLIPTITAVLLLIIYLFKGRSLETSKLFAIALAIALVFSTMTAYYDTRALNRKKLHVSRMWEALENVIEDDSVIVVPDEATIVYLIPSRLTGPNIRFVFPSRDNYTDTFQILDHYKKRNKIIYLFNPHKEKVWDRRNVEIMEGIDYEKMLWLNVSVHTTGTLWKVI